MDDFDGADEDLNSDQEQAELEVEETLESDVAELIIQSDADGGDPDERISIDIGIDCEYQTIFRSFIDPKTKKKFINGANRILSYQWHCIVNLGNATHEWSGWYRPILPINLRDPGKATRITLNKWLEKAIIDGIDKGKLPRWPDAAVVFSHFLRAELGSVSDFSEIKDQLSAIGGSFIKKGKVETLSDPQRLDKKRYKPSVVNFYTDSRNKREVYVKYMDTMLLTPGRSGLAVAGDMIGIQKLSIPEPYSIEKMEEFLKQAPAEFEEYAMRDAEIAVKYGRMMRDFCRNELGLRFLPVTSAAMGLRLLEQRQVDDLRITQPTDTNMTEVSSPPKTREQSIAIPLLQRPLESGWEEVARNRRRQQFGYRPIFQERFDLSKRKIVKTKSADAPVFARSVREAFAAEAYHGGRNESFMFGPTDEAVWTDYDLKAAYTTAMCLVRPLDYERTLHLCKGSNPRLFRITDAGFARVVFNFNTATTQARRFPCLPVRTQHGLLYPIEGETVATAAEISLAVRVGATIKIVEGMIVPAASEMPIFEAFSEMVNGQRTMIKRSIEDIKNGVTNSDNKEVNAVNMKEVIRLSAQEKLWKEIGNSLYGKTAQGVRDKKEFDPRIGRTGKVPPSDITNPFLQRRLLVISGPYCLRYLLRCLEPAELFRQLPMDFFVTWTRMRFLAT